MDKSAFEPNKSFENLEEGTRFIYRRSYSTTLQEEILEERSPSGGHLKFRNLGWLPLKDLSTHYTIVEVLGESKKGGGMCSNCVTPWKCNGPHLKPCRGAPRGSPELEKYFDDMGL